MRIWTVTRFSLHSLWNVADEHHVPLCFASCCWKPPLQAPTSRHKPHSLSSHTGCPAPSPAIERCLENQVSTLALEASAAFPSGFLPASQFFKAGIQAFAPCKLHSLLRRMFDPTLVTPKKQGWGQALERDVPAAVWFQDLRSSK